MTKNKEFVTPELFTAIISIAISIFALWLVIENKPVLSGYREINCQKIQDIDGSYSCVEKMDTPESDIRVFTGAH